MTGNITLDGFDARTLAYAFYVLTSLYIVVLQLAQAARYRRGDAGAFSCANWTTQMLMRTGPLAYGAVNAMWLLVFLVSLDIGARLVVLVAVRLSRVRSPRALCPTA
jgi:hypothetical protein